MTSSTDTNIFISLWDKDASNMAAAKALDAARLRGRIVTPGAVYAELLGGAGRSASMLDMFFEQTGITVDWAMDRQTWELAGAAYHAYLARRKKTHHASQKRLLTDFIIGAHAMRHGHALVTLDQRLYRAAFPELTIIRA